MLQGGHDALNTQFEHYAFTWDALVSSEGSIRVPCRRESGATDLEWINPHNPDSKVGMTKHGSRDMVYKPAHTTDLESGAIVAATVRCGGKGDTVGLAERTLAAGETLSRVCGDPKQERQSPASETWEHLECSFFHVLVHGALRRATLRGRENPDQAPD